MQWVMGNTPGALPTGTPPALSRTVVCRVNEVEEVPPYRPTITTMPLGNGPVVGMGWPFKTIGDPPSFWNETLP